MPLKDAGRTQRRCDFLKISEAPPPFAEVQDAMPFSLAQYRQQKVAAVLNFSCDNRPHQSRTGAVVDLDLRTTSNQPRIAIENHDSVAFRSARQLHGQTSSFCGRMLNGLWLFIVMMIVPVIMFMMGLSALSGNRQQRRQLRWLTLTSSPLCR
jgi:hypothetical protein